MRSLRGLPLFMFWPRIEQHDCLDEHPGLVLGQFEDHASPRGRPSLETTLGDEELGLIQLEGNAVVAGIVGDGHRLLLVDHMA